MYTYDSFETIGDFTLMRPLFVTILAFSLLIFITLFIPKFRLLYHSIFLIVVMSVLCIVLSAQLLFYHGILVDELGMGGDPVSFYSFIAIAIFSIINPIIFIWKKRR